MAQVSSGSFNTTSYEGRYYKFSWTVSQSIPNNQSTLSWKLEALGGASSWYAERTLKVVVAGETVYSKTDRVSRYTGTVATGTKVFTHDNSGKKSFSASVQAAVYTSAVNCSGSGSWELTQIPRQANITAAPNFNDEQNPTITYNNAAGNTVTSLQACIADQNGATIYVGYRDISKTGNSYTFTLTDAERNTLRNATKNSNALTVKFYVKTVIGGVTYYSNLAKTLSIVNANPTLKPTVVDSNNAAIVISGSNNKLIRYKSNAQYAVNATALKGATITSYKVECGGKTATTATGTINAVESGKFTFTATDSRGNTSKVELSKQLIEYVKLTCDLEIDAPDGEGNLNFNVNGAGYKGTFATGVSNFIRVSYRYKENSGSYTAWSHIDIDMTNTSERTYSASVVLTGLNYQSTYTFDAYAVDMFGSTATTTKKIKTQPLFEWGENDFKFNIPVYADSFNLGGAAKALSTTYNLETTVTKGANYASASTINSNLIGNNLRCYFAATRTNAPTAGNIANETVCSFKIKHDGKIRAAYAIAFGNGATGGGACFVIANAERDDTYLTFDISLGSLDTTSKDFSTYFILPVSLNLDAY